MVVLESVFRKRFQQYTENGRESQQVIGMTFRIGLVEDGFLLI
jgi:hypothetical protein